MPNWLDPQTVTITRLLHDAGYVTGHFGKWHLTNTGAAGAPPPDEIDEVLDLKKMTEIGVPGGTHGAVAGG